MLEGKDPGHPEGEFRRVNLVEGTIDDRGFEIDDGKPATTPLLAASRIPSVMGLMYSFGTTPPTISLITSLPLPSRSVRA